jgi:hypothetical protein
VAANNQIGSGAVVMSASADPLIMGLNRSQAALDAWGAKAKASMNATTSSLSSMMTSAYNRHNDSLANKMKSGFDRWQAEQKARSLAALPATLNQKAAAAQVQAQLDALRHSTDAASGSANALSTGLGGIAKGLKLTETLGMGALGALAALHKASLDAFAMQHGDKLAAGLEERRRLANQVGEALDKVYAKQQDRARNVDDLSSYYAIQSEIEAAIQDLDGKERWLGTLRKLDAARMNDFDRYLGKATLGHIPIFDMIHQQQEQGLRQNLEEAQKRHDDLKKHIEMLKGMSLMGLAKSGAVDPLVKGLDDAISKGKEFFGLVTGNATAIRKQTADTIKSLREQHDLMGLDPGEEAVQRARSAGETDEQKLAEIRLRAEANARKQATLAIDEQIKAMELEAATYGMAAEAAKRYQLEQAGATADQLKKFDELNEKTRRMRDGIEAAMAPKVAGAVLAGSEQAYAVEVRMKGFDIGDGNAIHKANGEKLDKLIDVQKEQARNVDALMQGMIRLEGM